MVVADLVIVDSQCVDTFSIRVAHTPVDTDVVKVFFVELDLNNSDLLETTLTSS